MQRNECLMACHNSFVALKVKLSPQKVSGKEVEEQAIYRAHIAKRWNVELSVLENPTVSLVSVMSLVSVVVLTSLVIACTETRCHA